MLLNVFTLRSFPRSPPFDRFEKIWRFNIYFFQMICPNKSVNVHISCISCSDFSPTYFHISLFLQKSFVEVSGLLLKEMGPSYNNLTFQISSLRNWKLETCIDKKLQRIFDQHFLKRNSQRIRNKAAEELSMCRCRQQ